MQDPIVEEIRKIRDEHAAHFNYDLNAIFDDFERHQKELGLPLVTLSPNPVTAQAAVSDQPAGRAG